jgi:hypothetical protein
MVWMVVTVMKRVIIIRVRKIGRIAFLGRFLVVQMVAGKFNKTQKLMLIK